jgi:PAS domain-containing protein
LSRRREAEDELRRTSELLRLIGDSAPDLIYAKDRESRMLYANAAFQRPWAGARTS